MAEPEKETRFPIWMSLVIDICYGYVRRKIFQLSTYKRKSFLRLFVFVYKSSTYNKYKTTYPKRF